MVIGTHTHKIRAGMAEADRTYAMCLAAIRQAAGSPRSS
ncbi:MAG: hypothetical protein JWM19_2326 [Actinomycetia bacterium]|nr:hypothetical protein [Actinomycetes bacterium]